MSAYFLADERGRVKIGSAKDVGVRLATLQCGTADRLSIVRLVDGGRPTERWLQRRFKQHRLIGEWFSFVPEMLTVIAPAEVTRPKIVTVTRSPLGEAFDNGRRDARIIAEIEELEGRRLGGRESAILLSAEASP